MTAKLYQKTHGGKELSLGYSPCPNDTFIFYGLVKGKIETRGLLFRETLLDVEELNRRAFARELDITKASFRAFGLLRDGYCLLRSGGAIGRGAGPLVVSKGRCTMDDLKGRKIAIPGGLTTASLLLELYGPSLRDGFVPMHFSEIMGAVSRGEAHAGVVIHEGRFTYGSCGLSGVMDLGKWWEEETGLPVPLGGIIAKRTLGAGLIGEAEALIRESLLYSMGHKEEPMQYIREHAQELQEEVIEKHIGLYVNEFSLDMGQEGASAVRKLFLMAEERGIIKPSTAPIFME